jgi:hypothetical protein
VNGHGGLGEFTILFRVGITCMVAERFMMGGSADQFTIGIGPATWE